MSDMLILLPAMFLANKIDFTVPENVLLVRSAFIGIQVILLSLAAKMYLDVSKSKDDRKIRVPPPPAFGQEPVPESQWEVKTVSQYDMGKLQQYVQELVLHTLLVGFIHYKWGIVPPLLMQTLMNPMRFYRNPLAQVYIFGAKGPEYERPFKEETSEFVKSLFGDPNEQATGAPAEGDVQDRPGTIRELPDEESEEAEEPGKASQSKEAPAGVISSSSNASKTLDDIDDDIEVVNEEVDQEDLLLAED